MSADSHTDKSSEAYRVDFWDGKAGCEHCGAGAYWTVVGPDDVQIGTSWGDKETAEEICDLMNMAYDAGTEARSTPSAELPRPGADTLAAWLKSWWTVSESTLDELRKTYGPDFAHLMRGVADMIEQCTPSHERASGLTAEQIDNLLSPMGWNYAPEAVRQAVRNLLRATPSANVPSERALQVAAFLRGLADTRGGPLSGDLDARCMVREAADLLAPPESRAKP